MGVFHRKSKWEQLSEPLTRAMPKVARAAQPAVMNALRGLGVVVGVSAASAAVTAVRQRKAGG